MRRLFFVLLMILLPLQWSWASAASVCSHEEQGTHFGHHEHAHQKAPLAGLSPDASPDADPQGSLSPHPDCGSCHGTASVVMPASKIITTLWMGRSCFGCYASAVPDRFVDGLLRPPSPFVS